MDLSHITSQSLRRILNLTERKDQLVNLVAEIESEIAKALTSRVSPVAKSPAKKISPARKDAERTASRKAKSGSLKANILSLLDTAGAGGMKVKEIAEKLGAPAGNISVWFSTTGKKLTQKLEQGRFALKGAKPSSTPAKASSGKTRVAAKSRRNSKEPSPLKERILAVLNAAGPQGIRVKDIAAKLGLPGGNVSVWISTTGKSLVSKVEPGVYAVKGAKPVGASTKKTAARRVKKAAKPSTKKSFKLPKNKGKN